MALGANAGHIVRLVLGNVGILAAAGIVLGVPAALFTTRFAGAYLYGVTPHDPATIAVAVGVLLLAALVASYAPARFAATLEPTTALRRE